jgi:hypothetical protein
MKQTISNDVNYAWRMAQRGATNSPPALAERVEMHRFTGGAWLRCTSGFAPTVAPVIAIPAALLRCRFELSMALRWERTFVLVVGIASGEAQDRATGFQHAVHLWYDAFRVFGTIIP